MFGLPHRPLSRESSAQQGITSDSSDSRTSRIGSKDNARRVRIVPPCLNRRSASRVGGQGRGKFNPPPLCRNLVPVGFNGRAIAAPSFLAPNFARLNLLDSVDVVWDELSRR